MLFYQPLFWWLRRQLRLCQDYLADDRAAALASAEDYATYLVRLAIASERSALQALGVSDRRSNLYRRVAMLVQDHEPLEHRCRPLWSVTAGVRRPRDGRRLGSSAYAAPTAQEPTPRTKSAAGQTKDVAKPSRARKAETLHYTGKVKERYRQADRGGHGDRPAFGPQEEQREHDAPGDQAHDRRRWRRIRSTIPPEQMAERSCISSSTSNTPTTQRGPGSATPCR